MHRSQGAVHDLADPDAVQQELTAQVERAVAAGVEITHIDSHMGTVFHPRLVVGYMELALSYGVPPFLVEDLERWRAAFPDIDTTPAELLLREARNRHMPVFDRWMSLPLDKPEDRVDQAKRAFEGFAPGLSMLIVHPAQDSPELRAIAPDWQARVADYDAFTSEELHGWVAGSGIHIIGYRALRDAMLAVS